MSDQVLIFGGGDMAERGIEPIVGGTVVPHKACDVRNPAQVDAVLKGARPDVVVNCAGVSHPHMVAGSNVDDWVEEIETNLIGSYHIARISAHLGVRKMIFIASVAGKYGKPEHSGYSASKGGVISLVQSLALEGLEAYAISPGRVDTKMRERDYPGEDSRTRLKPTQIGAVVHEILRDEHQPGDNLIIRKRGLEEVIRVTDRGEPWKKDLAVGEPKTI